MEVNEYSDQTIAGAMRRVLRGEERDEATEALYRECAQAKVPKIDNHTLARAATQLHKNGGPDAQMALEEAIESEAGRADPRQMELQEA